MTNYLMMENLFLLTDHSQKKVVTKNIRHRNLLARTTKTKAHKELSMVLIDGVILPIGCELNHQPSERMCYNGRQVKEV